MHRLKKLRNIPFASRTMSRIVNGVSYLDAETARNIDTKLMGDCIGFLLPQLVELAGQAVAAALLPRSGQALILCGRGNNGADGLVVARHLQQAGVKVYLWGTQGAGGDLGSKLLRQAEYCGVTVLDSLPSADDLKQYNVLVDALCGFSYRPPARDWLKPALSLLAGSSIPVCSIDVPSGWDVELGPGTETEYVQPSLLVSLSAPKLCALSLSSDCTHVLGGRFVPKQLQEELGLSLPDYPGQDLIVTINKPTKAV